MAPSIIKSSLNLAHHKNNINTSKDSSASSNANRSITESLNGSTVSYKFSDSKNICSSNVFNKENQRPPIYNPEDYALSLRKFSKRHIGPAYHSIYEYSEQSTSDKNIKYLERNSKASTLPNKHNEYKSPIVSPPKIDSEMSLRQFATITDLLSNLRADLRCAFPSFVQEFVTTPSDGVSLLLEVLRAIQLSQSTNTQSVPLPRNYQYFQRRALLDELACLQCLSICCTRLNESVLRLGTTPIGLMPLASSATGQGIRARIVALQLMTAVCDYTVLGHGSQKSVTYGHTAVSQAMSTLRLRCSEPVRFRLLVGMLNSGGGSGELQAIGMKFFNTFLESSENLQQRLYVQAELSQAGLDPNELTKTISASSPWLEFLRREILCFNDLYVNIDRIIIQARESDRVRNQMVILERRVQILHEEKSVLTSMERRLQERCAELQREIFRLQANHNKNYAEKQPIALPRHVSSKHCKDSSEHEDEGISSSETGPSLSPSPILAFPQKATNIVSQKVQDEINMTDVRVSAIDEVVNDLGEVINEVKQQIISSKQREKKEKEIIPINIVPQPPRKSRSLSHLISNQNGSDLDGSEYDVLILQNQNIPAEVNDLIDVDKKELTNIRTFFEVDYDLRSAEKTFTCQQETQCLSDVVNTTQYTDNTTRELLDVIMNARHNEDDPTIQALRNANLQVVAEHDNNTNQLNNVSNYNDLLGVTVPLIRTNSLSVVTSPKIFQAPPQQFNGVFFMTGMNTPQKYPKPDMTAVLEARRVSKNVERFEAVFAKNYEQHTKVIGTREKSRSNQQIYFGTNQILVSNTDGYNNNSQRIITSTENKNIVSSRTRSFTLGSKVTDLPSGLY